MENLTESIIETYVQRIVQQGHPLGIILFGSYARDSANENSDVDLLVIEETPDVNHHRALMYRQALRPRTMPLDLLVLTPAEIRDGYARRIPFLRDLLEEGRWVYGDPRRAGLSDLGSRRS
ncbi:MAG: nucleotidyltransferase domain-containing protein [Firmicutes bacterium]|nr:nucleotidyltransferase domain-containing protein [Bacillota bacterium]